MQVPIRIVGGITSIKNAFPITSASSIKSQSRNFIAKAEAEPRNFVLSIIPFWAKIVAGYHKKQQKKYLRKYGLYYEDALLDWKNPKLDLAISLLPPDVRQDRLRRIQRANYLRQNHEEIDYTLRFYDPHTSYGLLDLYNQISFKEKSNNSYI